MKIIGMNTTVKDFDENNVTVDTLIGNLKTTLRKYAIDEKYYKLVVDLYNKASQPKNIKSTPFSVPKSSI